MKKFGLFLIAFIMVSVFTLYAGGGQSSGRSASNEPVTIRVLACPNIQSFRPGEDENNNDIYSYLEKVSGYKLRWSILPTEGALERLTLEIASGDPSDLIFLKRIPNPRGTLMQFANDGYLMELDEYIKNEPMILSDPTLMDPELRKWGVVNGKQYAIPTVPSALGYNDSIAGLKSLTEPMGLLGNDMTPEGIQRMFAAVKQAYPDKIILTGPCGSTNDYQLKGFRWLYGAFGVSTPWRDVGGRLEYTPLTNDMRNCLQYIAGLNAAGYLDPEIAILKEERVRDKLAQGNVVFANMGWYDWINLSTTYKVNANEEPLWQVYGNAKGGDGRSGQFIDTEYNTLFVIPATSKVPQEAVNLVGHLTREETNDFLVFGIKGMDYNTDAEGNINLITNRRATPPGQQYYVYYMSSETVEMFNKRIKASYSLPGGDIFYVKDGIWDIYSYAATVRNPAAIMPVIPQYIDRISDINSLCAEYFLKIAVGALPISSFDEFLTRFNAIGGNDMVNAVNQWYTTRR